MRTLHPEPKPKRTSKSRTKIHPFFFGVGNGNWRRSDLRSIRTVLLLPSLPTWSASKIIITIIEILIVIFMAFFLPALIYTRNLIHFVPFPIVVKSKELLFHFERFDERRKCSMLILFIVGENYQLWGYLQSYDALVQQMAHATSLHSISVLFVRFHFRRCSWTYLKIEEKKENFRFRFNRSKTSFDSRQNLDKVAKLPRIASDWFETCWHLLRLIV